MHRGEANEWQQQHFVSVGALRTSACILCAAISVVHLKTALAIGSVVRCRLGCTVCNQ